MLLRASERIVSSGIRKRGSKEWTVNSADIFQMKSLKVFYLANGGRMQLVFRHSA